MAINLTKGQTIDLRKNDKGEIFDLSFVATLLKVSVLQTRYQDHYHHCEGK